MATPDFFYQDPYPLGPDETEYYNLTSDYVELLEFDGKPILKISPEALTLISRAALRDTSFLLRSNHLKQIVAILEDPEASDNDKYVALTILRNAEISAKGILPFCQDTGTATVFAQKGQQVWTGVNDYEAIARGGYQEYTSENLRYSQVAPLDVYNEKNTMTNLPAQIDIHATQGMEYNFLFIAKGGGSANKTALFQKTKALLNPKKLESFLVEKLRSLGTAACPPYHVAFVIGGTSAEACLKTLKLATARFYDALPTKGNEHGQAFRDLELEERVLKASYELEIGAQFGGKHFVLDVRIIRLPRHGASCPVGMGVSCSADRNIRAKINKDGLWIEKLEKNPGFLIPEAYRKFGEEGGIKVDLNQPMKDILSLLSKYPVGTRLSLSGIIIVGRDIAHARLRERLEKGDGLPQYLKDHPIYYAGPAKTPKGFPSGSFGPTTASRMDSYVDLFQQHGGSLVMIAKGNRSQQVTDACKKYGGFYLGSIGGPAAVLAEENIRKVELLEYPDLGMEAIFRIEVQDFPAFILVDDKGNDFYRMI